MPLTAQEQSAIDAINGKTAKGKVATVPPLAVPTPQTILSHAFPMPKFSGSSNPFLPLVPVFTGAARAIGTPVGKVFDVINRSSEASEATQLRGKKAGFQALVHSESPDQYQADTAQLNLNRQQPESHGGAGPTPWDLVMNKIAGRKRYAPMTKQEYDAMPAWWHQATELETQIFNDPVTYAGGAGIAAHLMEAIGGRSFIAFSRAVEAMQASENAALRSAGHGFASAYDFAHYKGATARKLAAKSGDEGIHQFRGLKAINNARRTQALDLSRSLTHQYDDVVKGLSSDEEDALYQAVHAGKEAELPPNLSMRAAAYKNVTDQLAHLEADPGLRAQLAEHGFTLPPAMKRFEGKVARGLQDTGSYRMHYVPTAHETGSFTKAIDPDSLLGRDQMATADTRTLHDILRDPALPPISKTHDLNAEDVSLRERGDNARLLDPKMQQELTRSRLRRGAQAIAAHDAEKRVADLFGKKAWSEVPADAKEFFQETYTEPGGAEFWKGIARGAIDIPKVGLFALPFRHMANIGSLSFLADPSLGNVFGTAGTYMRLLLAKPTGKILKKDPAEIRAAIFGKAGEYGVTGTPSIDRATAAGWIGKIPGIGELYKASNHLLWTFDDAAKATRFNRLLRKYQGDGLDESHAAFRAADEVGAELIDYSNRSPLTKALSYMVPFAAYRSKMPVAIFRSVTRRPEVAANLGRRSPELIGDEQQAPPDAKGRPQVGKSYLPLAEVLRGVDNPMEYARATAGYPLSMAISIIGGQISKAAGRNAPDVAHYTTYGKDPDLKYLLNATVGSFPGGESALGALGLGEFLNQGSLSGAVRGQTGFGISRGPSPMQNALPGLLEHAQAQADAARKRGDKTTATAIETAIERVRERYRLYVP